MSVKVRRSAFQCRGVAFHDRPVSGCECRCGDIRPQPGVVRHQRSEWCGQPVNDMLYIKGGRSGTLTLRGRCYQRACLSGRAANTTHLPVSPSVTGKMTGIGDGRSVKQADGGVKLKLSPSTRSVFRKTCPGQDAGSGGDMNAVHQRLYPVLRMSSAASSWMTFSLSCVRARCSISEVAEPRGKCSARDPACPQ